MVYKSLFLLVFATLFNQAYNLDQIQCPKWLPGTNEILPQGVTLSPDLELENRVRCYCEVVKAKEADCLARQVPGWVPMYGAAVPTPLPQPRSRQRAGRRRSTAQELPFGVPRPLDFT